MLSKSPSSFSTNGYSNWVHANRDISSHETSRKQFDSMRLYLAKRQNANCGSTIERGLISQLNEEIQHWRDVLRRFLSIIRFLAENDIALRGTGGHERLGDPENSPFLGLVEMMSLYDSVLASHLSRVQTKQIFTHYISKTIQDEFIDLLGKEILYSILEQVKGDRLYFVMLDCTLDINHDEKMSLVLRRVHTKTDNEVVVYEHFISFLKVEKSTELFLTNVLLKRFAAA